MLRCLNDGLRVSDSSRTNNMVRTGCLEGFRVSDSSLTIETDCPNHILEVPGNSSASETGYSNECLVVPDYSLAIETENCEDGLEVAVYPLIIQLCTEIISNEGLDGPPLMQLEQKSPT